MTTTEPASEVTEQGGVTTDVRGHVLLSGLNWTARRSASPLIGVPVCIGDGRPYNTALITLDSVVAGGRGTDDHDLVSAVQFAVDTANEQLSRVEQIRRFSVIDGEWHADGDELTPTSKLKRRAIAAKYASEIEAMYPGPQPRLR